MAGFTVVVQFCFKVAVEPEVCIFPGCILSLVGCTFACHFLWWRKLYNSHCSVNICRRYIYILLGIKLHMDIFIIYPQSGRVVAEYFLYLISIATTLILKL